MGRKRDVVKLEQMFDFSNNNRETTDRIKAIEAAFARNPKAGLLKAADSRKHHNAQFAQISKELDLPCNILRMQDENGKPMLVAVGKAVGFGGFGTAYETLALTGPHAGEKFGLKQQRLASVGLDSLWKRIKQVIKRPFMNAPNEQNETNILKLQGAFFGETHVNYADSTLAETEQEKRGDARVKQSILGEEAQSRYFVLQPFLDGGDFSKLQKNIGKKIKEGPNAGKPKSSWDTMPLSSCTSLINSATDSLFNLHKKGWSHNDLHHENIMIKNNVNGKPKAFVMDFGLAAQEAVGNPPAFTKAQVADIKMMLNGKKGKPGSLTEILVHMHKKIDAELKDNPNSEDLKNAQAALNNVQNKLNSIKVGDDVTLTALQIQNEFNILNDFIAKPEDPNTRLEATNNANALKAQPQVQPQPAPVVPVAPPPPVIEPQSNKKAHAPSLAEGWKNIHHELTAKSAHANASAPSPTNAAPTKTAAMPSDKQNPEPETLNWYKKTMESKIAHFETLKNSNANKPEEDNTPKPENDKGLKNK